MPSVPSPRVKWLLRRATDVFLSILLIVPGPDLTVRTPGDFQAVLLLWASAALMSELFRLQTALATEAQRTKSALGSGKMLDFSLANAGQVCSAAAMTSARRLQKGAAAERPARTHQSTRSTGAL